MIPFQAAWSLISSQRWANAMSFPRSSCTVVPLRKALSAPEGIAAGATMSRSISWRRAKTPNWPFWQVGSSARRLTMKGLSRSSVEMTPKLTASRFKIASDASPLSSWQLEFCSKNVRTLAIFTN